MLILVVPIEPPFPQKPEIFFPAVGTIAAPEERSPGISLIEAITSAGRIIIGQNNEHKGGGPGQSAAASVAGTGNSGWLPPTMCIAPPPVGDAILKA